MGRCLKLYCRLAKNGFLVQNRRLQIAKSQIDRMGNRMRIFSHLVADFGCSHLVFLRKYVYFTLYTRGSKLLP
jgi:hypothetical protein